MRFFMVQMPITKRAIYICMVIDSAVQIQVYNVLLIYFVSMYFSAYGIIQWLYIIAIFI